MNEKKGLSHLNEDGTAVMVDVSEKDITSRVAIAAGTVSMQAHTMTLIQEGGLKKGDVISVARLAGILGAKRTPELIPLCHPLALQSIEVKLDLNPSKNSINIESSCKVMGQTGVEMEALTAVSVAALTVYDMCKAVDRSMVIEHVRLEKKSGGQSGEFRR